MYFVGWTYNEEGELFRPNGKMCSQRGKGRYLVVKVCIDKGMYEQVYQHRIIFFLHYGYFPESVDHKDRDTRNNRPDNLRDATLSEQNLNRGMLSTNTSGIIGVNYDKTNRKYRATLQVDKVTYCKRFTTEQEAIEQRVEWEWEHGLLCL